MQSQRHLFQLPENTHYINCAYMSPLLKSAEQAGIEGLIRKRNPSKIAPSDFFESSSTLRKTFAQIINSQEADIAIIPSASYGLMNAVENVPYRTGEHALVVSDEFPSGQFAALRFCETNQADLVVVSPEDRLDRCAHWNQKILDAIQEKTSFVLMSSIHWTDGTLFDLEAIGRRCQETNTFFIVDGSQSVGALPMDVDRFHIDALICATYKWLLGPYSMGLAFYGEKYKNGKPIEESWMNRSNAQNFGNLTAYDSVYTAGAGRYNVGETSHFIHTPIVQAGLDQLLNWGIESIPEYCRHISAEFVTQLREHGYHIEEDDRRAFHLFGLRLPDGKSIQTIMDKLNQHQIVLSVRGSSIRVSPHLYNTKDEFDLLSNILLDH